VYGRPRYVTRNFVPIGVLGDLKSLSLGKITLSSTPPFREYTEYSARLNVALSCSLIVVLRLRGRPTLNRLRPRLRPILILKLRTLHLLHPWLLVYHSFVC
jgi:hypothetical protein